MLFGAQTGVNTYYNEEHPYVANIKNISDTNPDTFSQISDLWFPEGTTKVAEIGTVPTDITLPQWDNLIPFPSSEHFDNTKLEIRLFKQDYTAESTVTFKYGKMVSGSFVFVGQFVIDPVLFQGEYIDLEAVLSTNDYGVDFVDLPNMRVEIWVYKPSSTSNSRLNIKDIFISTSDFSQFQISPRDHIWHGLDEPVDITNAYSVLDGSDGRLPLGKIIGRPEYVNAFISANVISDWGNPEIKCTFGADSSQGVKYPSWPYFVRSKTVNLCLDHHRNFATDTDTTIGIEYGTINAQGDWTYLGDLLPPGITYSTGILSVSLDSSDFGGNDFEKLHELRVRVKTSGIPDSEKTDITLAIYAIYLEVETSVFTKVHPIISHDPDAIWTNLSNILDGNSSTYAFAVNLGTFTGDTQDTYSLLVGATGPLIVDSAWETFPTTYYTGIFKTYLSSSSYSGDDVHAMYRCGVNVDNELYGSSTWNTTTTGFSEEQRPNDELLEFDLYDFNHSRLALDGDIDKGSDGKELRLHYCYWAFYIEGDAPIIEDPIALVILNLLSGIISPPSPVFIPGVMTIFPSLQTVISDLPVMSLIFSDITIPVELLSLIGSLPIVRFANIATILLNLLSQVSGITLAQIQAGQIIAQIDATFATFTAETVTHEYSGLATVDLFMTSFNASTNVQIAPGTANLIFTAPLVPSNTEQTLVTTGAITVDFLAHVLSVDTGVISIVPGIADIDINILPTHNGVLELQAICLLNEIFLKTLILDSNVKIISVEVLYFKPRCEFIKPEVTLNMERDSIGVFNHNEISVIKNDQKTLTFEYKP